MRKVLLLLENEAVSALVTDGEVVGHEPAEALFPSWHLGKPINIVNCAFLLLFFDIHFPDVKPPVARFKVKLPND